MEHCSWTQYDTAKRNIRMRHNLEVDLIALCAINARNHLIKLSEHFRIDTLSVSNPPLIHSLHIPQIVGGWC